MDEEALKKSLIEFGWKWVYVPGHGDVEPIIEGDFVVGDIEKGMVLVPPNCIWKEAVPYEKYY